MNNKSVTAVWESAGRPEGDARVVDNEQRQQPQEVGGTHYQQGLQVSPWELQRTMKSSGNAFVDARRADAIKYAWRMKGDRKKLVEDMKKALHCLTEGIQQLERDCQDPELKR